MRFFCLVEFVKCWKFFWSWILEDYIEVQEKEKKVAVLYSGPA